jgi:hypothetical protein
VTEPYILAAADSVFLSTDGRTNWLPVEDGLSSPTYITALGTNGGFFFLGADLSGVFLSPYFGMSWSNSSAGLTNINFRSISTDGKNVFVGTSPGGVFLSTDDGASWNSVNE